MCQNPSQRIENPIIHSQQRVNQRAINFIGLQNLCSHIPPEIQTFPEIYDRIDRALTHAENSDGKNKIPKKNLHLKGAEFAKLIKDHAKYAAGNKFQEARFNETLYNAIAQISSR